MRHRVVLPAPLGPTRPMRSRSAMRQVTSRKSAWPPKPFEMSSRWITGPASPHALDLLGRYLHGHPHFSGLTMGIAVLPDVLLRERVDMSVGALLRLLAHTPPYLKVWIGILGVLHRQRDPGVTLEIARLHPPAGGVEPDVRPVVVDPHRRHLGGAISADGGDVRKRLLVEEVSMSLWNGRHDGNSFLAITDRSAPLRRRTRARRHGPRPWRARRTTAGRRTVAPGARPAWTDRPAPPRAPH